MSERPFVMLDRDGTINVGYDYLSDPNQVELIPGAAQGLREMRKMGFGLVIITNQSGIARGFFDLSRLDLIHQRLCGLLGGEGIQLDGIYVCPHHPDDHCACRKPQTALVRQAARELGFDPIRSFFIGDQISDMMLGQAVGATTLLVVPGNGSQLASKSTAFANYVVEDLCEAAYVIRQKVFRGARQ